MKLSIWDVVFWFFIVGAVIFALTYEFVEVTICLGIAVVALIIDIILSRKKSHYTHVIEG